MADRASSGSPGSSPGIPRDTPTSPTSPGTRGTSPGTTRTSHDALARAGQAAALTCLAATAIGAVAIIAVLGLTAAWIVLASTIVTLLLYGVHMVVPSWYSALGVLVAGTLTTFLLTALVFEARPSEPGTNTLAVALPIVAMVLVGGTGTVFATLLWSSVGFTVGLGAVYVAGFMASRTPHPNFVALFIFVLSAGAWAAVAWGRGRRRRALSRADGSARHLLEVDRRRVREAASVDQLADVAFAHLGAVGEMSSGEAPRSLRRAIDRDLGDVLGRDWRVAFGAAGATDAATRVARPPSAVEGTDDRRFIWSPDESIAVRTADQLGIEVRVTGDVNDLARLNGPRLRAVDEAIAQCAVNVARHAGVSDADLVIGRSGGELTIAVIDSGVGFDPDEVPADRIGLRTSVISRIELVGGSVRVWSQPGIGTNIVFTLPEGDV